MRIHNIIVYTDIAVDSVAQGGLGALDPQVGNLKP